MKEYLVKVTCEYLVYVEADNERAAKEGAEADCWKHSPERAVCKILEVNDLGD